MELTSNLIVAKTGKIRKELTVRNTMGTGFAGMNGSLRLFDPLKKNGVLPLATLGINEEGKL